MVQDNPVMKPLLKVFQSIKLLFNSYGLLQMALTTISIDKMRQDCGVMGNGGNVCQKY